MTPNQYINAAIVARFFRTEQAPCPSLNTAEQIDAEYDALVEDDYHHDSEEEIRKGEIETNIPAPCSRHYESKSVAALIGGRWIGWTYWHGGGKHGEPQAMDWDPYFLDLVSEREVTVVEREFKKSDA